MILILGGTSDAAELARALYKLSPEIIYSTATEYGSVAVEKDFGGTAVHGRMDKEELLCFLNKSNTRLVIDATHPYAQNISRNAMSVCRDMDIDYIRYERKKTHTEDDGIILCNSSEEAGEIAEAMQGVIFVTTGSKDIEGLTAQIRDLRRLRVRVLPMSESILKLEGLKLNSDNIIAVKGPFSVEMNYLMLKESNAAVLICKDSGSSGGTEQKLTAARQLGIKVIMIRRPDLEYADKFEDLKELQYFVGRYLKG